MELTNGNNNGSKRQRDWSYDNNANKKATKSVGSKSNTSSSIDDEAGHFFVNRGFKFTERYEVCEEVGKGTFGKVFHCKDAKYNSSVAIKVIRSIERYIESARIEVQILSDVYKNQKDQNVDLCVKLWSRFRFDGHYCMVFESLGMSLLDLIKMNNYSRLPMPIVQSFSEQLLLAARFLKSMNLIHTDLKLENIMLVNSQTYQQRVDQNGRTYVVDVPYDRRIKLIDFGGATYDNDHHKSRIINTRQYRGPEVTLEVGWSFPSDLWCIGCLICELYSGELLFQTHEEIEHLSLMHRRLGPFPLHMLRRSPHDREYFNKRGDTRLDKLSAASRNYVNSTRRIEDFFNLSEMDKSTGIIKLVKGLLRIDPNQRYTSEEALKCDFFERLPDHHWMWW